jgi:hypothetical protein
LQGVDELLKTGLPSSARAGDSQMVKYSIKSNVYVI